MTVGSPDPRQMARYLRHREELGERELILEGMDGGEALRLLRNFGARPRSGGPDPGTEAAPRPEGGMSAVGSGTPRRPLAPEALPEGHDELERLCAGCTRCRLAEGRSRVVFADGNPAGRVMVVGEAPGQREDATGLPFVGPAGKLLDLLLASVGLSRGESVYICNVIKCRPPANRNPRPDEIEQCSPYLRKQIAIVRPEAILAVGTFAAQVLSGRDMPLGRLRGEIHSYEGTPLVVTYHPAALLRNSGWTPAAWEDLQLLRQVLDGS